MSSDIISYFHMCDHTRMTTNNFGRESLPKVKELLTNLDLLHILKEN